MIGLKSALKKSGIVDNAIFNMILHNIYLPPRDIGPIPKMFLPKATTYISKRTDMSISEGYKQYKTMNGVHDLKNHKSSNTLSIMGSGSSINDLTDNDLDKIDKTDSIALNWWGVYHDYVPDFYKFELGGEIKHTWIDEINEKHKEYKDTVFIFEPERMYTEGYNTAELLDEFHPAIREDMVDMRVFQGFAEQQSMLNYLVDHCFPFAAGDRLLHYRGSLSQAIALGYLMGYDEFILFGVDLDNSGYFFSEYENSHKNTDQEQDQDEKHSTAKNNGSLGIDQYIYTLSERTFEVDNKKIYIGSDESLLYPRLPHYTEHRLWDND